ncbi:MAG: 1-phosphofructokinase family hexose kinase [Brevinemataceae bacterium]
MVLTITLNPAVDYYMETDSLSLGKSFTAKSGHFVAGGKGINVSRVLSNFNIPTKAVALLGGFTGNFIAQQTKDIIEPIFINDTTRLNTKIKTSSEETEIHGKAPEISSEELLKIKQYLSQLTSEDILIMSGSIPGGISQDIYFELAQSLPSKDTKVIIDTRGIALKEALKYPNIFLIKPNKDELVELSGQPIDSYQDAYRIASELKQAYQIENIIVSLGKDGACLLTKDNTYYAPALTGTLVSSVGAGDSLVAGFTAKYLETRNTELAFQFGIASASGTVFSEGLCSLQTANILNSQISIQNIKI